MTRTATFPPEEETMKTLCGIVLPAALFLAVVFSLAGCGPPLMPMG